MAIGRTFKESLQKALRGLETGRFGLGCDRNDRGARRASRPGGDHQPAGDAERRAHLVHPLRLQGRHDGRGDSSARRKIDPLVPAQHPRDRRHGRPAARVRRAWNAAERRSCCWKRSSTASPTGSWRTSGTSTETEVRRLRKASGVDADVQAASTPAPPSSRRTRRITTRPTKRPSSQCGSATHADRDADRQSQSRRRNPPAVRQGPHHDPRRRPQPHRPGHRVRLLLLPGRVRPARGRLRDHHGQLEPGDRLDRLRHQRPSLLRAADRRGRAQHLRPRCSRRG